VGSTMMTSFVACESSFMIQSLYSFRIPGIDYDFSINTTHVAMLIVSVFIIVMAIVARLQINKAEATDTPGAIQNVAELIVEMLGSMVDGIMGKNASKFVNYISALFIFIIISNISGLFGLRPPTADYGVTLALGLITFVLIQFNGIKKNKVKHFTSLFQPIWFLFPINLIGEFAVPLSLSLRLFGNVMSGTVLMGLIYDLVGPYTVGYPALLHAYFDLFSGCIQAYVFSMLTMVYVNDKIAD
jgi:F-type H+-transporting ATPase subunit a